MSPEVFGAGKCPVCGARIRPRLLMCARDWWRVPPLLRVAVSKKFDHWEQGHCTLEELRSAQDRAIEAVQK